MTLDSVLYTATATAEGGREGRAATDDGRLDVVVSVPKEMGGPGTGTNPEQLFAAGYSACFHSALQFVARKARQSVQGSTVTGEVGIGSVAGGAGFGLQVHLRVHLPGVERDQAEELVAKADTVCPYSNATRGNVAVTIEVVSR
ncbi:MAG: organic hydroperoxide resistance protein [Actinomycetota bacterium]|nr:organic hydroperoxide resistance protein [Actinomycetota bacterium]